MAIANGDLRQQDTADELLIQALETGHRLGLVRTFLDESAALYPLLAPLVGRSALGSSVTAYLKDLLSRFEQGKARAQSGDGAASAGQKTLTPRELAILQLISQAMSNKRVALTLSISLETVKWNLKNVFLKLGVSSRYDAVSWARKHGLIP
ncbi:HTH-type transcriptional regulator AlkS [compost metagenome]